MTIYFDSKPALYTQLFSAVPDQWPGPARGEIGLGNMKREKVRRGEEKGVKGMFGPLAVGVRCRTVECWEGVAGDSNGV
ncbi:hypothetical protein AJ79_07742 [Helicocarpus griseus UAMH5409]|uniref:Uncharacterized protein n=1 Tax=Helicocarpus griseus UAMH5409 TaxID=1447875 RepID=A0A2B7WRJ4_9EURO|nr:hypothetical protein AJ79_07742 [Helicocarpus griseus UAMH5409]